MSSRWSNNTVLQLATAGFKIETITPAECPRVRQVLQVWSLQIYPWNTFFCKRTSATSRTRSKNMAPAAATDWRKVCFSQHLVQCRTRGLKVWHSWATQKRLRWCVFWRAFTNIRHQDSPVMKVLLHQLELAAMQKFIRRRGMIKYQYHHKLCTTEKYIQTEP
jgi:hypothetical protein